MTDEPKPRVLAWLEEANRVIPDIERTALRCAPEFRQIAFEVLLQRALGQPPSAGPPASVSAFVRPEGSVSAVPADVSRRRFGDFLGSQKLTADHLGLLVDYSTGHIIARDVGASVATRQRNIAGLIALWHAWTGGEFDVPYDQLATQCKEFAAEDTANMSSNLRRTEFGGSKVFISTDSGWRVTTPGQQFVGSLVRSLLGLPETTRS